MKLQFLARSGIQKKIAAILSAAMLVTLVGAPAYAADADIDESVGVIDEISEVPADDAEFEAVEDVEEEQVTSVEEEEILSDEEEEEAFESEPEEAANDSVSSDDAGNDKNTDGTNPYFTVSSPSISGDFVPSEDDYKTFVFQGGAAEFDSTYKIVNCAFNAGNVKLSYKIPGAKKYAIARLAFVDTGAEVTVLKSPEDGYKKKTYTDKSVTNGIGLYVVEGYSDGGTSCGKYITMPASFIMSASSVANTDVRVTFAAVGFGCKYKIESCENNKFHSLIEEKVVSENALEFYSVGGRYAYIYTDKGRTDERRLVGSGYSKRKVFYRVTAMAAPKIYAKNGTKIFDGEMVAKPSNKMACYGERYAAFVIDHIEGTEQHKYGCYSGAVIYFKTASQNGANMDINDIRKSNVTYDILRTINGKTFTSIATVKGSQVRPARTVNGENLYGIDVSGLVPGMKYSYAIVATKNGKKTEMSNVFSYYFDFVDVFDLRTEAVNTTTIRLKWTTEQCATKYVVYRTADNQSFATVSEANAHIEKVYLTLLMADQRENLKSKDLKLLGLKKAKTINNTLTSGAELTADVGKLKNGQNYAFMVVPVNENSYGYRSAGTTAGYSQVASPKTLNYTTKGITSFKLSWSKVAKAQAFLIERIEVSDQRIEDSFIIDGDWKYLFENGVSDNGVKILSYKAEEVPANTKNITVTKGDGSTITTAKPGVCYIYRVRTVYDSKGTRAVSEPIEDVYQVGVIGPKQIKEFKSEMLTKKKSDNYFWDNTSNKNRTLSDNMAGARGVKLTFAVTDKKNTDHYEVEKSTDDGYTFKKLGTLVPGSKNEANTYKPNSTSITFYDDNLQRGIPYTYRVRPIAPDGTPGAWVTVDFSVASGWYMYAKKNSNKNNINCVNKRTAFQVQSGQTYRFYIVFNPLEVTTDSYDYRIPSWLSVEGRGTEEVAGIDLHYIDVKVAEGTSDKDGAITLKYDRPYDEVDKGTTKVIKDIKLYVSVPE